MWMTFEVINYFQRSGFALKAFLKSTRSIWRPKSILHIGCAHVAGTHVSARGRDCDFLSAMAWYTIYYRYHCGDGHQPLSMKCGWFDQIAAIFPGFFLQYTRNTYHMFIKAVLSGRNLLSHSCQWCKLTKWQKLSLLDASSCLCLTHQLALWKIMETEHTGLWLLENDFLIRRRMVLKLLWWLDKWTIKFTELVMPIEVGGRLQIWSTSLNLSLSCMALFGEETRARLNSAGFIKGWLNTETAETTPLLLTKCVTRTK